MKGIHVFKGVACATEGHVMVSCKTAIPDGFYRVLARPRAKGAPVIVAKAECFYSTKEFSGVVKGLEGKPLRSLIVTIPCGKRKRGGPEYKPWCWKQELCSAVGAVFDPAYLDMIAFPGTMSTRVFWNPERANRDPLVFVSASGKADWMSCVMPVNIDLSEIKTDKGIVPEYPWDVAEPQPKKKSDKVLTRRKKA
jgi:hypothetical protein